MSDPFNLIALRRLYNPGNVGRGVAGRETRASLHTTITYPSFNALGTFISIKKGGYGAPVIELAIRIVIYLCGGFSKETVAGEIAMAMLPIRLTVVTRLRELADTVENYRSK
jgi:hypothetical protein